MRPLTLRGLIRLASVVATVLFGLSYFGIVGDGWAMTESQIEDFLDNPLSYKGKTLTMELEFEWTPLEYLGREWRYCDGSQRTIPLDWSFGTSIYATVPAGMKVPSLMSGGLRSSDIHL